MASLLERCYYTLSDPAPTNGHGFGNIFCEKLLFVNKMKVYIVFTYMGFIVGVFTSRKKAEKSLKDGDYIEKYPVKT
jgi:hypothetical protein